MAKNINIYGRLHSQTGEGIVTTANEIYDEELQDYQSNINKNVGRGPDEEDINYNTERKLQFANRIYNSVNPDGLGYKILRKGSTFAAQVTDVNTIYEIRYSFNLNNASVTIPAGSVLRFNGGKISNGSINFNGCALEKDDADNIFAGITSFSGEVSAHFTPENVSYSKTGDCFGALLSFLKSGQHLLKIKKITLTSDTDFHGVWLDAVRIELNGYTLKLGGANNRVHDGSLTPVKSQDQKILAIGANGNLNNGRVIVGPCSGFKLHIGLLVAAPLEFILDQNNAGIGYSSFYLNTVTRIELKAENGVTGAWINTNRFVLNRCVTFIVAESLKYFNNNTIEMGCFEGKFNIRLETGNNNTFKDIRGEATSSARGQVYFADTTAMNVVEIMYYPTAKIFDYGRGNIVRNNLLYNSRLLDKANISLQDLKRNLPSRIMGMTLSQDGTYLVPSNTADPVGTFETDYARYYQTGFIPYRKQMTIFAILDVVAINEPGLGFAFETYDENLAPVRVNRANNTQATLGLLMTSNSAYTRLTSGTYFPPFQMEANYRPGNTHVVSNEYSVFRFTDEGALNEIAAGDQVLESSLNAVKYITISVVGRNYFYTSNSKILSVGVAVYEPGYKVRMFNSDVGETPSE